MFTASEGPCPSHTIVIGNGRIFYMESVDEKGDLLTPQQCLQSLKYVRDSLDNEDKVMGIPILTSDDRDSWATVKPFFTCYLNPHK